MKIALIVFTIVSCLGLTQPADAANDMLGVDWKGYAYAIDSSIGMGVTIGLTGFNQLNGMAVDPTGKVYAGTDTGSLITIDPNTGVGTLVGTMPSPVRALAFDSKGVLYMSLDYGNDDLLAYMDVATMNAYKVGMMGFANVDGLVFDSKGTLWGWDRTDPLGITLGKGLITLDLSTGAGTDVNPAIGTPKYDIRFLAIDGAGTLYGGCNNLMTIDKLTGNWTVVGSGGYTDLRGCDFVSTSTCPPYWQNYGAGYPGANGVPTLALSAQPKIGTQVNLMAGSSAKGPETSILFVGFSQALIPGFWGGALLLQPAVSVVLPMPPAGYVLPIPIPNDPKLCGFKAYFQTLQSDPGAKMGAASSQGLELSIGT